jgi:23S rRNA (cytosine1962-C5)-methyltransferase
LWCNSFYLLFNEVPLPNYIRLKLKPKEENRILAGHPWIYANEIQGSPKAVPPGTLVEVVSAKGEPLGRGVANPASKILVRLLTRRLDEEIDEAFVARKVQKALDLRKGLKEKYQTDGLRLIFGEADGLPGVIADSFGETTVLSCFSAGMKQFLPAINRALQQNGYQHVYEKSVGEICQKEGMSEFQGWLGEAGSFPLVFSEGGARFEVKPDQGQKTGFYLDFRPVRRRLFELSAGRKILDSFCYTGAASIQAALGGAAEVLALDSSQEALEEAAENAKLNGLESKIQFQRADSFKHLKELRKGGAGFDGILLDPPPLAKSVHDLKEARGAFKRLVGNALDLLNRGGFLVAASCSHHFSWILLEEVCRETAEEAGRPLRLLERLTQPEDHPVVLSIPETEYLRVLILKET